MLNPARIRGAIAEKIQRKQDRTTLMMMAAPVNAFTSKPQKKLWKILAEGVTLMGRQTDTWSSEPIDKQKKFIEKTRHILELEHKKLSDEEARQALEDMQFFFKFLEKNMSNRNQLIANTRLLGGSDVIHAQLIKDLKEVLK